MKKIAKYVITYIISVFALLGLLVLSACLPNANIKKHIEESSEYLYKCSDDFSHVIEGNNSTILDHYSDSILLGIAYNIDSSHPFKSIVTANYYRDNHDTGYENLYNQVINKYECNTTYERYWHGSLIWIRFLLEFTNIKGIYLINGIIMALLFAYLIYLLIKRKAYPLVIALLIGGVTTYSFFAPLALESTWTYLIMLLASIAIVIAYDRKRTGHIIPIFIITGVLTNFNDFLTAETMTLTIPLIVFAYFSREEYKVKDYIKCMAAWLLAYLAMWFTKWCIAAVTLKESITEVAYDSIVLRTVGNSETLGTTELLKSAFKKNISALFPLNKGTAGIVAVLVLAIIAMYLCIVFQKKKINKGYILSLLIIFIIPYVRFLVLHEHSGSHYFHTYRAQISTFSILTLIVTEMVNWKIFRKK